MSVSPDTAAVHMQRLQAALTTRADWLIKADISSMLFDINTHRHYIETAEMSRGKIKDPQPWQILGVKQAKRQICLWRVEAEQTALNGIHCYLSPEPNKYVHLKAVAQGQGLFHLWWSRVSGQIMSAPISGNLIRRDRIHETTVSGQSRVAGSSSFFLFATSVT